MPRPVGTWYYRSGSANGTAAASPHSLAARRARPGGGPGGGGGGRGGGRGIMTVDMAATSRQEVVDYITVVGNLIGEATVDVVPRVGGPHRRASP